MAGAVVMLTGNVTGVTPDPLKVAEPVAGQTPWIVNVVDAPAASVRVSGVRFWRQLIESLHVIVTLVEPVFVAVIEPQADVCPVGIPIVSIVGVMVTPAAASSINPHSRIVNTATMIEVLLERNHARDA